MTSASRGGHGGAQDMYLIIIAWIYVVVMMALAEAFSKNGTVLGAVFTLLLYGALPLGLVVYILGTPGRRRRQRTPGPAAASSADGDRGGHAAGAAVAPEREEV